MFESSVLSALASTHENTLRALGGIEQELKARFFGIDNAIRALILAVASGEPLLLVGPPGTAKSRLIRSFCATVGILDQAHLDASSDAYFEYLLTPFTEPNELFGYFDIARMQEGGGLHRIEQGMMQQAKVVYLDELFNGSSAILNTLLSFVNEGIFHDRGERKKVAMQCLFAATNSVPDAADLRAIFDRFVLRCWIDNVAASPEDVGNLLTIGWSETYGGIDAQLKTLWRTTNNLPYRTLLDDLERLRRTIRIFSAKNQLTAQKDSRFYAELAGLAKHARDYDLSAVSNRRLVKMTHVMLIHALYAAVEKGDLSSPTLGPAELDLFPTYFLDVDNEMHRERMKGAYRDRRN